VGNGLLRPRSAGEAASTVFDNLSQIMKRANTGAFDLQGGAGAAGGEGCAF